MKIATFAKPENVGGKAIKTERESKNIFTYRTNWDNRA
jgi:hypothetical protein